MAASGTATTTLRIYNRVAPIGRPLAIICLFAGYVAVALSLFAPEILNTVLGFVSEPIMFRVAYFVTFAYPAAYGVLVVGAGHGAVSERIDNADWNRRDRIYIHFKIVYIEWTLDVLFYMQFPLALMWCLFSLPMGLGYAIFVWGWLGIATVGVVVGNLYRWHYDPDDLPAGVIH